MQQPQKSLFTREMCIVIALTIASLLPFVTKAFHIDDPLFLWTAEKILVSPLDYYGFSLNWYGIISPMSEVNQNPPLIGYFIAAISLIRGMREIALHIGFILPSLLFTIGTYLLARLLTSRPLLATILVIFSPAFMVSSTNIMSDTLMVALFVWSIYLWIYGITSNKNHYLVFSATLIFFATVTKYFAITSIPLLLAYTIFKQKRYENRLLFLLLPIPGLFFYQNFSFEKYGVALLGYAATYVIEEGPGFQFHGLLLNTLSGFSFLGGSVLSIIFFAPYLWKRDKWPRIIILLAVFSLLVFIKTTLIPKGKDLPDNFFFILQFGLLGSGGILLIFLAGEQVWRHKDEDATLLFLWIVGSFAFTCYINHMVTARNMLPIIPAAGILLTRQLKAPQTLLNFKNRLHMLAPVLITLALTLSVTLADFRLANSQRQAAIYLNDLSKLFPKPVYF